MKILGISSDFHDSSAAFIEDGKIRLAVAEERLSYQKHDSSFPSLALQACLRAAGCAPSEIDWVAYHEDPVMKFSRVLTSRVHSFPRGFGSFARSMREMILGQMWVKLDIFKKTGISPSRIHYVPHHLSHAAYAFATSGFSSAAVLVVDAVGEWSSTTLFRAKKAGASFEIETLGGVPYPHSLGMLYSAFTGFLGFRVNDGECSTMALASFGQPRYVDRVRRILRAQSDGTYELDTDYFDFSDPEKLPLSKKFFDLFGEPRSFRDPISFAATMDSQSVQKASEKERYYANVAASVQSVLEEAVLALCEKLYRETGEENLCLAGGVALNSTMNGRIMRESSFSSVHVPPDPGDGGGALGAALYLQSRLPTAVSSLEDFSPFYGLQYEEPTALDLIPSLEFEEISFHRTLPTDFGRLSGLSVERFRPDEFDKLADSVAEDLKRGKIVGWVQGRFENGARALGNRSLLIDPRNAETARRLSRNVKLRAAFRPYACSVTAEKQALLFDGPPGVRPAMRWMSSTHSVKESGRALVAQALHVDGTTRPQVLMQKENPRYHRLLQAWEATSGAPALLNTSFNESGFPMVSSPIDALLMFVRTDIETLVLNNAVLRKRF
jgi:carbamoyltransferase